MIVPLVAGGDGRFHASVTIWQRVYLLRGFLSSRHLSATRGFLPHCVLWVNVTSKWHCGIWNGCCDELHKSGPSVQSLEHLLNQIYPK